MFNKNINQKKIQSKKWKGLIYALPIFMTTLFSPLLHADDIDIYTKAANFGTGGDPVMTFVIDTSGSMAYDINADEGNSNAYWAPTVFTERMFQLQNTLLDQVTSMSGDFSVGLFSYDSDQRSGTLEKEAKPLGQMVSSSKNTIGGSGQFSQKVTRDVAQATNQGIRDHEHNLAVPYLVSSGARNSLGTTVTGVWSSSAGATNNLASAVENNVTPDAGKNKFVRFYATTSGWQTFWLRRNSSSSVPNPYLYLLDSSNSALASNDDASSGYATCPSGWNYDAYNNECWKDVVIGQQEVCGWFSCHYEDIIQRQYQSPSTVGADINSTFQVYLTAGQEYTLIAGTQSSGQGGGWTLSVTQTSRGYFYTAGAGVTLEQRVGLRFNSVDVPRGATITSARLIFRSSGSSDSSNLIVGVDESLTPVSFDAQDLQDASRTWDFQTSKFITGVTSGNNFQIDVKALIENQIGRAGWCGGEDIAFVIKDGGGNTSPQAMLAHSEETSNDPRLVVDWTHSGTGACYSKTVHVKTKSIGDDVSQSGTGSIVRENKKVEMGGGSKAGLRFTLVALPNSTNSAGDAIGLNVKDATIKLTAANNASPGTIYIRAVAEDITQLYSNSQYDLDGRKIGDIIEWNVGSWSQYSTYTSPDLSSIIQPILERSGWEYDGAIGLILSTSSTGSTKFYAFEENNGNSINRGGGGNDYDWNNLGTLAAELTITASALEAFENGPTVRRELFNELIGDDLTPNGGTPIAGSYVEAAEYMLGKGGYNSPLDIVGTCQSNTLVLLTDGVESYSYGSSDFTSIAGGSCSGSWGCSNSLASALKDGGPFYDTITSPDDTGKRIIKTYTIGYGKVAATTTKPQLQALANAGDGEYYAATDAAALADAFESIIGGISDSGASISVPGVAVSAFNRITLLDEVYYSLFKPSIRVNWQGNTKRYRLNDFKVVDVNNIDAVDLQSTYFDNKAHSWWSDAVDGPIVKVGGAGAHIDPTTRKVFTYLGSYGAALGTSTGAKGLRGLDLTNDATNINQDASAISYYDLGMQRLSNFSSMTLTEKSARRAKIIEWIQGGTSTNPRTEMGAPIHSSPVMIGYKNNASDDLVSTIYMSTNEGYLHAFDTGEPTRGNTVQDKANTGGNELFSFMPKETLVNAAKLEENAVQGDTEKNLYGLDSTWTYWRDGGENTEINSGTNDHVYIYSGMRRGGRMIYGLNVTDVYRDGSIKPKLLFAIGNPGTGSTPVSSTVEGDVANFNKIGQTWSLPKVRKIIWKGTVRTVLLFGGGYDPQHDSKTYEGTDAVGNQVYMTDAATGELLWAKATPSAITARLRPFDKTSDGYINSMYAVDVDGRILRFDLNAAQDDFSMVKVAELGGSGSENRKFYRAPSIALQQNEHTGKVDIMIAIGSGYRALPQDNTVQEYFMLVYDRGAYEATPPTNAIIKRSHLVQTNTTTGLSKTSGDANGIHQVKGWFYRFDKTVGEKALGSPLIFNGLIIYTSYVITATGSTVCTPVLGQTRLYIMDVSGKSRLDIFGQTGTFIPDVSPGLAADVQIVTINGHPVILNDKAIIKPEADKVCDLVNCSGRSLNRGVWTSKASGI